MKDYEGWITHKTYTPSSDLVAWVCGYLREYKKKEPSYDHLDRPTLMYIISQLPPILCSRFFKWELISEDGVEKIQKWIDSIKEKENDEDGC